MNHRQYNPSRSVSRIAAASLLQSTNDLFVPGYDGTLSPEEIRLMRLNYLNNGGHDQHILNKFTEMEYNARFRTTGSTTRPVTTNINYDSVAFELENKIRKVDLDNQRLQNEIENLQEKYDSITNGNAATFEMLKRYNPESESLNISALPPIRQTRSVSQFSNYPAPPPPPQPQNYQSSPSKHRNQQQFEQDPFDMNRSKFIPLQDTIPNLVSNHLESQRAHQMDEPYQQQQFQQYPPQQQQQQPQYQNQYPNQYPIQNQNQNQNQNQQPLNNNTYRPEPVNATPRIIKLKDLSPAAYDPIGGFVIFIDYITYLDPIFMCARIITCLHHPKSGLGEPSMLPIVNCDTYQENGRQVSIALISTKQPVPRCPAQQPLTILMELQAASKDLNNQTSRLKSCAWIKLPLFDNQNRLLSGRWKARLKSLPIKADANISTVEQTPEFGGAELYYRLVNIRDADEQTNAPISPVYSDQYTYINTVFN